LHDFALNDLLIHLSYTIPKWHIEAKIQDGSCHIEFTGSSNEHEK